MKINDKSTQIHEKVLQYILKITVNQKQPKRYIQTILHIKQILNWKSTVSRILIICPCGSPCRRCAVALASCKNLRCNMAGAQPPIRGKYLDSAIDGRGYNRRQVMLDKWISSPGSGPHNGLDSLGNFWRED